MSRRPGASDVALGLRRALLLSCLALAPCGRASAGDRPAAADEYQVKAAFLFNFARFAEWPADAFASPDEPIVIGIVGWDPFGRRLDDTIAGKTAGGHPLLVKRFRRPEDVTACHVLFIGALKDADVHYLLGRATHALTVSESEAFLDQGGVMRLALEEGTVRFHVNVEAAERSQVKLSSQLLKLARIFHEH